MKYEEIRTAAWQANMRIVEAGLVLLTWGNAGVRHPEEPVFAIKPSGVAYDDLTPETMVIVSIETGEVVDGAYRPSSDTPTYVELFRALRAAGAIVHTHSEYAVACAQAHCDIPILGTTHADHFRDAIPVTRPMTAAEVEGAYEANTGLVILETFRDRGIDPAEVQGVLVANHGPFAWGPTGGAAVENAIVLEAVARMALYSGQLNGGTFPAAAPRHLTEKHFLRKHGPGAYYGQGSGH